MQTLTEKKHSPSAETSEPVRLNTIEEVEEYLAKHLKPVRFGPKGQPIYAIEDISSLNAIFPEDG